MGLQSNEKWYSLNTNKLAVLLLPMSWRKPITVAFLQALLSPIKALHYTWSTNRHKNLYKVNHNYQIVYLEKALNDEFDVSQRRIKVEENVVAAYNYIYTFGENKPKHLGLMHLHPHTAYASATDFFVNMHGASADIYDIQALVDFYKLYGTRYTIKNNGQFTMQQNG